MKNIYHIKATFYTNLCHVSFNIILHRNKLIGNYEKHEMFNQLKVKQGNFHLIRQCNVDVPAGYKFDDKKPDSPTLKIQFARFPFRPPSDRDGKRIGTHASC